MAIATKPFHNRLAVIFDYDDTLAPDSYAALLESFGQDAEAFKEKYVAPLEEEGWDHILARFYALIQATREEDSAVCVTRERLEAIGREAKLYDGVPELFGRVREAVAAISPDTEVEFYILTAGSEETARAISCAGEFDHIWGCAFSFNEAGEAHFLKRLITHPEKTRYLLELSNNPAWDFKKEPENVYRDVDPHDYHLPIDQMVYVGDGSSDMPAFRLMGEYGGLALGVVPADGSAEGWEGHEDMEAGRRVQNLAPADYSEDAELLRSILLSVESICKRIELRRLSAGE